MHVNRWGFKKGEKSQCVKMFSRFPLYNTTKQVICAPARRHVCIQYGCSVPTCGKMGASKQMG